MPNSDGTAIAYTKGEYEKDLAVYMSNVDGSSERLLTQNLGGWYRPMFDRTGDRLYFFRVAWPNGPTGVPKSSIWEVAITGGMPHELADWHLFDDPLGWSHKKSP